MRWHRYKRKDAPFRVVPPRAPGRWLLPQLLILLRTPRRTQLLPQLLILLLTVGCQQSSPSPTPALAPVYHSTLGIGEISPLTELSPYLGPVTVLGDTRESLHLPPGRKQVLEGPLSLHVAAVGPCEVQLLGLGAPVLISPEQAWQTLQLPVGKQTLEVMAPCGLGAALDASELPQAWLRPLPPVVVGPPPQQGWKARLVRWFNGEAQPPPAPPPASPPAAPPASPPASQEKPDLVLITIDTLRPDFLTPYGEKMPLAPQLTALAQQGTTYLRARAHSPWTGPSVASLMTGRMSAGLDRMAELAPTLPTLAEQLERQGYRTLAAVNNPRLAADTGMNRGFERYRTFGEDEELVAALPELLKSGKAGQPVFLWVHLLGPHLPFDPSEQDLAVAGWDPSLGEPTYEEGEVIKPEAEFSPEERRKFRLLYRADIHHADRNLGQVLEAVRARLPKAALVLTSDHGEEIWEHGAHGHGHAFWRELLAVPLLAVGPLWKPGSTDSHLVRLCEVAPTFLKLAGAPRPDTMLCDTLLDREHNPRSMAANPLRGPRLISVEGRRWKLIRDELGPAQALYSAEGPEKDDLKAQEPNVVAAFSREADAFVGRSRALLGPLRATLTLTGKGTGQLKVEMKSVLPLSLLPQLPPGREGVVQVEEGGRRWTIEGPLKQGEPDRVIFEVSLAASADVEAAVWLDGQPIPTERWRIGGIPWTSGPQVLLTDQEGWRGDPRPDDGLQVDLWFRPRGEPPQEAIFTEEQRAQLRAIGYVE